MLVVGLVGLPVVLGHLRRVPMLVAIEGEVGAKRLDPLDEVRCERYGCCRHMTSVTC